MENNLECSLDDRRGKCVPLFFGRMHTTRLRENLVAVVSLRILVFIIALVGGGCGGGNRIQEFSWSISEAKQRGTLVSELTIVPESLTFAGNKITFESAWLERQPDGAFALCFRIDQGKEVFKEDLHPFIVLGDRRAGFSERHGRGWLQFVESLDSDDLSSVRASLIQNWTDDRSKNIRFVRKEK